MSYNLTRVDYLLCGITFPDTLKVLPLSESGATKHQKFAVGDKNGVIQCIGIKDEEPVVQFKSLPGKPITAVQLSSISGVQSDKLFAASGNEVKGYSRKGKVFFSIETSLSETITSMCVVGTDLVLGSGRTILHYRDGKELNSYFCEDRVLDVTVFLIPNTTRLRLLILEANKGVTILESGKLVVRTYINAGPSKLLVPSSGYGISSSIAFYGSADGSIGILAYDGSNLTTKCLVEGRSLGPVMCIGWFENEEGSHIAVGRHDGSIQLYLVHTEDLYETPRLKFTYFCGEPVTSVAGGCISSDVRELIASTFSGRIFALRPHYLTSISSSLTNLSQDALTIRRSKLEAEVLRLEKQAILEREKYQKNAKNMNSGISVPPLLDVQCELLDTTKNGYQEIRIMTAVPLDILFVYCKQTLDIETDNAAVLSICPSQVPANDLLATVRCQAGTRHLWIRVRYPFKSPTNSTKMLIYAFPAGAPRVARMVTLRLPFLPFYSQHEDLQSVESDSTRCWCELSATGKFSVAEITSWLSEALTGDLPRPSSLVAFARSHSLVNTVLICRLQKNHAKFKSEDISTIATLKKMLSDRSVDKVLQIEMECDIPKDFCLRQFRRIEDLYKSEYAKYKDSRLLKALECLDLDLNTLEDEDAKLCDDYTRVSKLSNADLHTNFEELVEIIVHWYESWTSLQLHQKNEALKEKQNLNTSLLNCDLEDIEKILSKN